ncbi:MAG: hypothetical protein OXF72_03080 [Gammaproteobacteria bacterium]|nr:hypothetical protein [Gammaproteobacteria bacterium]
MNIQIIRVKRHTQLGSAESCRASSCLLALLLCAPLCADLSTDYYRECRDAPYEYAASVPNLLSNAEFDARLAEGYRRAEDACERLGKMLAQLPDPTVEERLALMQTISDEDRDYCSEALPLAESLPEDSARALQIRSVCTQDRDESNALLLRSLEIDPENDIGLTLLSWRVRFGGAEVDIETLLRHWNTGYRTARYPGAKVDAAAEIYTTALDAGEREAAEAIRVRVRHDLGLDSLDFERREAALDLLCDEAMLALNLESLCTNAFERLAAESADVGAPLPGDILRPLERTIRLISDRPFMLGGWGGGGGEEEREAARRLGAVLEAYPDHLRSPEHRRVYAEGFLEGAARIDALREVAAIDPGNVAAHCGLARSLEKDSPDEAWSVYANLASAFDARSIQCDPHESMRRIEARPDYGTKLPSR